MKLIPLPGDSTPSFVQTVTLESVDYRLRFDWNDRSARWYFSILDSSDSPVVAGICMVTDTPLLNGTTTNQGRTPGDFMLYDSFGKSQEAGLADLGVRHLLYYVESTELLP